MYGKQLISVAETDVAAVCEEVVEGVSIFQRLNPNNANVCNQVFTGHVEDLSA